MSRQKKQRLISTVIVALTDVTTQCSTPNAEFLTAGVQHNALRRIGASARCSDDLRVRRRNNSCDEE